MTVKRPKQNLSEIGAHATATKLLCGALQLGGVRENRA